MDVGVKGSTSTWSFEFLSPTAGPRQMAYIYAVTWIPVNSTQGIVILEKTRTNSHNFFSILHSYDVFSNLPQCLRMHSNLS